MSDLAMAISKLLPWMNPSELNSFNNPAQQPPPWQFSQTEQAAMSRALNEAALDQMTLSALPSLPLSSPPSTYPAPNLHARAREMFLKRVGGLHAELKLKPDDFLACHIYNEHVYVFWLLNGKEGILHETIDLFPSDTLVTQIRLILS